MMKRPNQHLFSTLVLCACLFSPSLLPAKEPGDSTVLRDIRAVLETQSRAWNNGDIDGYMQGYWQSDSLLFTSGGSIERGWRAARNKYKRSYGSKALMGTLTFTGLEIRLLSGESAWVFGHWLLDREKDHPHGVFTLILQKFSEGWKIVHDHTSAEIPKPDAKIKK